MNAKRQLSGLKRVNFNNKSAKQTIKYLKNKYEMLGYDLPTYLQGKSISKSQLNSAINKITRGLLSAVKKEQVYNSKPSVKLDKQFQQTVKKYNREVDRTLEALKTMGIPKKQIDYLMGKDVMFPTVRKKSFIYDGVPLQKLDDIYISDNKTKKEMIKKFKEDTKEIRFQNVYNKLTDSTDSDTWFENTFLTCPAVRGMTSAQKNAMRKEFNTLSPLQKEFFIKGELSEIVDKYDEGSVMGQQEKVEYNTFNRYIDKVQTFKREDLKGVYD